MPISAEQARQAKSKVGDIVRSLAKVTGIGLTRIGGSYAVKVNLDSARPARLPAEIDGVPVVYEVTGAIIKRL